MTFLNLTAYRFVSLPDVQAVAANLRTLTERLELCGSIVLATEGINIYVAGPEGDVHAFEAGLAKDKRFADLDVKLSLSRFAPFRQMKVLVRKEIVTMGILDIDPSTEAAPHVDAAQFRAWLDAGRDMVLLDTRNRHEFERGTFEGAEHLDLSCFRDFPAAADQLPDEVKSKPVVAFCTGGIRCEKATAYLKRQGFEHICQLDGGILRYLEQQGDAHWTGECFVFDDRETLTSEATTTRPPPGGVTPE